VDSGRPYKDIEVTDSYIIREFSENIDPIELLWHRDDEDRTVEIIGETNWKLQLDNQLPTSLNQPIFIPKHEWHRVIKGTGTLKLKIHIASRAFPGVKFYGAVAHLKKWATFNLEINKKYIIFKRVNI
jgi:hypothetical protein